jgi:hypothetical protein
MFGGEVVVAVEGDSGDGDWSAALRLRSVCSSSLAASEMVSAGDFGAIACCPAPAIDSSLGVAGETAEASAFRSGVTGDGSGAATGIDVDLGGARGRGKAGITRGRAAWEPVAIFGFAVPVVPVIAAFGAMVRYLQAAPE